MNIELPLLELRPYQQELWSWWFKNRGKNKRLSLEWARRHGKDLFSLNIMIAEAFLDVGNYWHVLPQQQQVKQAIWDGITSDGQKYLDFIPESLIYKRDNQSMKIYLVDPSNPKKSGSIISFVGGDNYDKKVGAGLKGAIISEHSLQKPNVYDIAIEPMLKETKGWCIFNYTPRGENHATKMFDYLDKSEDPMERASKVTNHDTGLVTLDEIEKERKRGKPEELIQQEYYCDRSGANQGTYYGDILKHNKNKVGKFPYDPQYPVHTLWDLGISDQMAIWFVQFIQKEIRVFDYYENTNYALGHYASVLQGKGYLYAMHHLPHDGTKRQLTQAEMAISIEQQLKNLGVRPTKIHERRMDIYGTIQKVRATLPRCYFDDNEQVRIGYEALKQYRREWDENRQIYKNTPYHDWACLPKGTKVQTPDGYKEIQSFVSGDTVKINNVVAKVVHAQYVANKSTIRLYTSSYGIIDSSTDHKFFTARGLVKAKDLVVSDILLRESDLLWLSVNKKGIREAFIESFKEKSTGIGKKESYTQVKKETCLGLFIGNFGRILTEKYQKVTQLFLLMETGKTLKKKTGYVEFTQRTASHLRQNMNTKSFMGLSFIKKITDITQAKETEHQRLFKGTCGAFIMVLFQKVMSFIIKIKTRLITTLKTCNYCQRQSIQYCIHLIMNGLEAKKIKHSYEKQTLRGGEIIKIEKLPSQRMYDIEVEHHHAYVLHDSGIVTSNSNSADAFSIIADIESGAGMPKRNMMPVRPNVSIRI